MSKEIKELKILDPEVVLPRINSLKNWLIKFISRRKKLFITLSIIISLLFVVSQNQLKRNVTNNNTAKTSFNLKVDKTYEFPALNNQGKQAPSKIKFKITSVEKTNQVLVKDQTFTAKNNKLFLIVNLELRNDATSPLNLLPGDLIRLSIFGNDETKFAPDLHNNVVPIAAISTKLDRAGFVIPEEAKEFKLYIGEIEGKKEEVKVNFPS